MAALTFTASDQLAQPRSNPDGLNVARVSYVGLAVSLSVSDVILMVKLPEGAVIIDGYLSGKVGAVASMIIKAGILPGTATDDDFIANGAVINGTASTTTLSGTTKLIRFDGNAGLPYVLPAIAAATYPKYTYATVTMVSGSSTGSVSLQMTVVYLAAQ